jgi:hypothetical protein
MTDAPQILDPRARDAAFALATAGTSAPVEYDDHSDAELASAIAASGANTDDRIAAVRAGRVLCHAAYRIADWYRDGVLGASPEADELARRYFRQLAPGFTTAQYDKAFAVALTWTR